MKPRLSIVVPSLNEEKRIGATLDHLSRQTVPRKRYEIIVSDAYSVDDTAAIARRYADRVVENPSLGAGAGRNAGARAARSDYLAFVDADSLAAPTFVEGAVACMDGGAVACTGPIESIERDSAVANAFYAWWSFQDWLSIKLGFPIFPGFNIGVTKEAFFRAGGFGEHNYTCEDIDLSLRLARVGRIAFCPKMRVATSSRRVRERGYVSYILNAWNFVLFRRSRTWEEHRGRLQQRLPGKRAPRGGTP